MITHDANSFNDRPTDLGELLDAHDIAVVTSRGISAAVAVANRLQTVDGPNIIATFLGSKEWRRGPVLAIPFSGPNGTPRKFGQLRPHNPRKDRKGQFRKYEVPAGSEVCPYFPAGTRAEVLADKSVTLVITEAPLKALSLESFGYHAVGLVGVWNFGAHRETDANGDKVGPMTLHADFDAVALEGRDIVIVYDADAATKPMVRAAENTLAKLLTARGAKVRVARLPMKAEGESQGVDDYLAVHGKDALDVVIAEAVAPPPNTKPVVFVTTDEHRTTRDVLDSLKTDPDLYYRNEQFVRVSIDPETDTASIRQVGAAAMRSRITERSELARPPEAPGDDPKRIHPPDWLTPGVLAYTGPHDIRRLDRVSGVPVIRPNGTIHTKPGYDPVTRCYYHAGSLIVPPLGKLTRAHAVASAERLLGIVTDFPFADAASKSVYLSLILSVTGRNIIAGSVPGHLATANVRGSGKGLLMDCTSVIATGRAMPAQPYEADQSEMRKMLTTVVLSGASLLCLDNLPSGGTLGSAVLDMAITSGRYHDRILGGHGEVDAPFLTVVAATGNNIDCGKDASRRWLAITLDSPTATPEDRTGFAHPRLIDHVRANRGQYVADALTIMAAYLQAGRPDMELGPTGSFGAWSDTVRSAIVWAGAADPWQSVIVRRTTADAEAGELAALVAAWDSLDPDCTGLTVASAKRKYDAGQQGQFDDQYGEMPRKYAAVDDFIAECGLKGFDGKRVAYLMRKHKDRPTADGRRITCRKGSGEISVWRVAASARAEGSRDDGDSRDAGTPPKESRQHAASNNSPAGPGTSPSSPSSPSEDPITAWNREVDARNSNPRNRWNHKAGAKA